MERGRQAALPDRAENQFLGLGLDHTTVAGQPVLGPLLYLLYSELSSDANGE